ncbi:MAG TPA: pyridoxamine 5'-phosphate oxidase [Flavobacteriales bacterium]|nr:pyridoxamine 5'-phosphate oxidase [Flavobacteriales bacterium]
MSDFKKKIKHLREDFNRYKIDFKNLPEHPVSLFSKWMEQALEKNDEANAFVLSTVSDKNTPSSRVLLLRDFDTKGFTFFTNYKSIKANDIENNNNVALNFYWPKFQRQVRIIGLAEKILDLDSDKYFSSRPRESQIGAWVSQQSAIIPLDTAFANKMQNMANKFKGKKVERPLNWGGYKVMPKSVEFWQGRPSRLHDRVRYTLDKGSWKLDRLSP